MQSFSHATSKWHRSYAWCSFAVLMFPVFACKSSVSTGSGTTSTGAGGKHSSTVSGTGGAGGFVPPPNSYTVKIGPIAVPAGVEKTQCVTVRLGNMNAIHVGTIHNELIGVSHHMIVYKVNDTVESTTPTDCQPFTNTLDPTKGSPLMITQKHSETLTLPQGVAFNLDANQMLRLEMHYINPSQMAATVEGDSTFTPMPDSQFMNEAGFLFAGDPDITLPPNQKTSLGPVFIGMPSDLDGVNFFAFTGHEHQFGTNVTVDMMASKTDPNPMSVYNVPGFSWSEPETVRLTTPAVLPTGGGFRLSCDWNNTSANTVSFGESANNEMCFFWGYYWPNKGARVCFHTDKIAGGFDACCPGNPQICQYLGG